MPGGPPRAYAEQAPPESQLLMLIMNSVSVPVSVNAEICVPAPHPNATPICVTIAKAPPVSPAEATALRGVKPKPLMQKAAARGMSDAANACFPAGPAGPGRSGGACEAPHALWAAPLRAIVRCVVSDAADSIRELARFAEQFSDGELAVRRASAFLDERQDGEPVTRVHLLVTDPSGETWRIDSVRELRRMLQRRAGELRLPPVSITLVAESEAEASETFSQ
jgi:hypothetical protein